MGVVLFFLLLIFELILLNFILFLNVLKILKLILCKTKNNVLTSTENNEKAGHQQKLKKIGDISTQKPEDNKYKNKKWLNLLPERIWYKTDRDGVAEGVRVRWDPPTKWGGGKRVRTTS